MQSRLWNQYHDYDSKKWIRMRKREVTLLTNYEMRESWLTVMKWFLFLRVFWLYTRETKKKNERVYSGRRNKSANLTPRFCHIPIIPLPMWQTNFSSQIICRFDKKRKIVPNCTLFYNIKKIFFKLKKGLSMFLIHTFCAPLKNSPHISLNVFKILTFYIRYQN